MDAMKTLESEHGIADQHFDLNTNRPWVKDWSQLKSEKCIEIGYFINLVQENYHEIFKLTNRQDWFYA